MTIKVADEAWIALALLHRENPHRQSFKAQEVVARARGERISPILRPGVQVHIYKHAVANLAPSTGHYRMFYRLPDGTVRLFRPGDTYHPDRTGKTHPLREEVPEKYWPLLDWYNSAYVVSPADTAQAADPILQMVACGEEIWRGVNPDQYVADLRSGWVDDTALTPTGPSASEHPRRAS